MDQRLEYTKVKRPGEKRARRSKRRMRIRPEYDHRVHDVLNAVAGISTATLAERTFLSATTIRKWRLGPKYGGTRYPLGVNLEELARVAGLTMKLVRSNDAPDERTAMRTVDSKRKRQVWKQRKRIKSET